MKCVVSSEREILLHGFHPSQVFSGTQLLKLTRKLGIHCKMKWPQSESSNEANDDCWTAKSIKKKDLISKELNFVLLEKKERLKCKKQ